MVLNGFESNLKMNVANYTYLYIVMIYIKFFVVENLKMRDSYKQMFDGQYEECITNSSIDDNVLSLCAHCGEFVNNLAEHFHEEMDVSNSSFHVDDGQEFVNYNLTLADDLRNVHELWMFCGLLSIKLADHLQQYHDADMSIGKETE